MHGACMLAPKRRMMLMLGHGRSQPHLNNEHRFVYAAHSSEHERQPAAAIVLAHNEATNKEAMLQLPACGSGAATQRRRQGVRRAPPRTG